MVFLVLRTLLAQQPGASPQLLAVVLAFVTGAVMSVGFLRLWRLEGGVRYSLRSQRNSPGHSVRKLSTG